MKFKRTMAMVMATAMMLGLAACGGGSSSGGSSAGGDDEVKIAYIVKAKSDAFWTSMELSHSQRKRASTSSSRLRRRRPM